MRVYGSCPCCNESSKREPFKPSQEQLDATAPGGHLGYQPGRRCIPPDVCAHIVSYENLQNLPSINNVKLIGNKTSGELGLQGAMVAISNELIAGMFDTYN